MKSFTGLFFLIVFAGCGEKAVDTKAESESLMQASREWSKAATSRDVEKSLSYWADNAVLISAGEPVISGKQEIRKMIERSFQNPDFRISWEPKTAEVSESGDMGYLIEETTMAMKDSTGNPMTLHFNAVTIWKKQADGSWKNVVDVLTPGATK